MNKSDLKDGMVVELRNGRKLLVMDNLLFDKKYVKEVELDEFVDTLFYIGENEGFDIIKVYENARPFIETNCKSIWEREKEIDWSKVPVGTKVLVSDYGKNWYEHWFIKYNFDKEGEFKFKCIDIKSEQIHNWKLCRLAEEPKEEVTFDDICNDLHDECCRFNCDFDCNGCTNINCKYFEFYSIKYEDKECILRFILDNYNVTRK